MSTENPQLISFMLLRKLVGWLGIILPVILVIGTVVIENAQGLEDSISDYYYTGMRDVFVGILCSVAIFLFAYKGYEYKDSLAGNFACFFALGVAFFPTDDVSIVGTIHLICALLFFVTLIYFSMVLFVKSSKPVELQSATKRKRNLVYKSCGVIMIICIALIGIYFLFLEKKFPVIVSFNPVFWLEAIALVAFGVSWLTKGQFMLKDSE